MGALDGLPKGAVQAVMMDSEVNIGARSLEQTGQFWDTEIFGASGEMPDVLMQAEMMESFEKGVGDSSGCDEVRNMMNNPIFESDTFHFTFGGMENLVDLRKKAEEGYVQDTGGGIENVKQRIDFGLLGNLPEEHRNDLVARGDRVDLVGSDSFISVKGASTVWGNVSEANVPTVQPFVAPGLSRSVKKEVDEMKTAANAWKKSVPVMLNLQEDVGSFLGDGGLVRLDLDRARGNIRRLDRAIVGSLLGRRLPFWVLQNELQRKWGHLGLTQVNPMGTDCFLCWFENKEARDMC